MLKAIPNTAKKMLIVLTVALFVVSMMFFALPGKVYAATLNVGSGQTYSTIQAAINAAQNGDTIIVAAGTYDEQIVINKSLTIQGAGDTTIIQPSQTTANSLCPFSREAGGTNNTASIIVADTQATNVIIKNLKIDGSDVTSLQSGADTFVGILYRGTNGTIDSVTINGIKISNGNAIYLSSLGQTITVEVKNCNISDFRKNGITANYGGLTANIEGNTITGMGPTNAIAQNGIQIGYGATGTVSNNEVANIAYTGTDWVSAGILFFESSATAMANTITNCQDGINIQGGSQPIVVTVENNIVSAAGLPSNQPYVYGISVATYKTGSIDATIKGNQLTGGPADDEEGIEIYPYSGNVSFNIADNNVISGWDYGIMLYSVSGSITGSTIKSNTVQNNTASGIYIYAGTNVSTVTVNYNNIIGNAYGVYNDGTGILDATNNWWGDASGPSGVGPGTGDAVSDNVSFDPWLTNPKDYVAPAPPKPLTPEEQAALDLSIQQQVAVYGASNVGFTKTLYDNILGRAADEEGLNEWVTALNEGKITLRDVVFGFVFSKELEPIISPAGPEEFITFLYKNVLDREPDPDGFNNWLTHMQNGMTKEEVLSHFVDSDEFKSICEMFGLAF